MGLISRLLERRYPLAPSLTRDVVVERDIPVPMADGTVLLGQRTYPRGATRLPTLLIRSPYGRSGVFAEVLGVRLFAERGFNVFMQSCRGTNGSGGVLEPFRHEQDDGIATIQWMKAQRWYSGAYVMSGGSYLAYNQWAIAQAADGDLKGLCIPISSADIAGYWHQGGGFQLESALYWMRLMANAKSDWGFATATLRDLVHFVMGIDAITRLSRHLPISQLDRIATGKSIGWWRGLAQPPVESDGGWAGSNYHRGIEAVQAPTLMLSGWHDVFLPLQLRDYCALRDANRRPRLIIGPWTHGLGSSFMARLIPESFEWLKACVEGGEAPPEAGVQLYVMGVGEWRRYECWPPPPDRRDRWYLHGDGSLRGTEPVSSAPRSYRYDPGDPTPAVGGARLAAGKGGRRPNTTREKRPDVLIFTTDPLPDAYELIGTPGVTLFVGTRADSVDFFIRLCEVDGRGISWNICDGYTRLCTRDLARNDAGTFQVDISLAPTAIRLAKGHRLRLQVSSGAHPHFARNLGDADGSIDAVSMTAVEVALHFDPQRASCLFVDVMSIPNG